MPTVGRVRNTAERRRCCALPRVETSFNRLGLRNGIRINNIDISLDRIDLGLDLRCALLTARIEQCENRVERAFSQRVRTAADMLFWAKPMAPVQVDLSEQQLADGFVQIGTVRDCGHLALAPDALRMLSAEAPRAT